MSNLKAYTVGCRDDDHGQAVVFAERGKDADRYANAEVCDCEFIDRTVRRSPAFDKYAPGPVTIEQYLAEGWSFPCGWCDMPVCEDTPAVICDGNVFCSRACIEKRLANDRPSSPGWNGTIARAVEAMERWLAAAPAEAAS